MTRVAGDWISRVETQAVCSVLMAAGHRVLFVGGCVRNALLGVAVADIDIATDALPERVMSLAKTADMKVVPTGIDHGTVTVISGGVPHEVTTFRRDVETFGRHAVVAFTDRVEQDARRRDFTMNALYAEPDGAVVDPLNGLGDLRAGRVRFIEDADARINEDFLRILRFFRFHAWYGDPAGGLDPDGLAACAANSDGIETLSNERVGAEMRKLLAAPDPGPSVAGMAAAGCLRLVLPGADAKALPVLVHLEDTQGVAADSIRRLAVLGGDRPQDRLRLSNAMARDLGRIRDAAMDNAPPAELAYRLGRDTALSAVLVRAALTGAPLPQGLSADIDKGAAAKFPLTGGDLSDRFEGPALGAQLRALEAMWIASDFTLGRAELLGRAGDAKILPPDG